MSTLVSSKALDRYYTPAGLAARLLEGLEGRTVRSVADFAVGGGALLSAASRLWPNAVIVGVDLDSAAIDRLADLYPQWQLLVGDFLGATQLATPLSGMARSFDLILLNPPFSARGNRRARVKFEGDELLASPPAAFVAGALKFLAPDGVLRAILPRNTLLADKDAETWAAIGVNFAVREMGAVPRGAFAGATADAVIVEVASRRPGRSDVGVLADSRSLHLVVHDGLTVAITRGNVPVHTVAALRGGDLPIVHTTSLKHLSEEDGHAIDSVERLPRIRTVCGPTLLLPRVGLPHRSFLSIHRFAQPVGLTDCLFALCAPNESLQAVRSRMLAGWDDLLLAYGGSCARYLTSKRLVAFLGGIGVVQGSNGSGTGSACSGS